MPRTKKVGDLQINEDMEFQERSWVVQRIGWLIFILLILLAALGIFGNGMLSSAQAGQEQDALWVEYPRFERFEHEFKVTVHSNVSTSTETEIRILVDQRYLEGIKVNRISPAPDREIKEQNGIAYVFQATGNSPFSADFYMIARKAGSHSGRFELQSGDAVGFSQFIFP
jgi:hypothetical protein